MNCLPVIEREMRSAARRTSTFGLRVFFTLAGAVTCLVILALPRLTSTQKSRSMLTMLSFLGLAFCLFAGGALTADCVSSEKRQGTLGLLFLTPLKGLDIVLGKMFCHGLQMFYGICAVFPLFFLPLLTGGVTWGEVSRIVLALVLALLLSASVGMLISVLGTDSRKTLMSTFTSILLLAGAPMIYWLIHNAFLKFVGPAPGMTGLSPVFCVVAGFDWSYRSSPGPRAYWSSLLIIAGLSFGLIITAGLLIGRVIQVTESSKSAMPAPLVRHRFPSLLERNPYAWNLLRMGYSTNISGGLVHWLVAFFAFMLLLALITKRWEEGFVTAFFTALAIHLVTKLRFAVEATRQIHSDHQTGALELLLVTDLPAHSVLEGHHIAIQRLARKPLLILLLLNLALESCVLLFPHQLRINTDDAMVFSSQFLGGMVMALADLCALRWIGFRSGLRASSHIRAVMQSYCAVMIVPWAVVGLIFAWLFSTNPNSKGMAITFCLWVLFSLIYDGALIRRSRRQLQAGLRRIASEQ